MDVAVVGALGGAVCAVAVADARVVNRGEAEGAEDVGEEDGEFHAVASSAAPWGGDKFGEEVLGVEEDAVEGVVVDGEVLVGEGGDLGLEDGGEVV